MIRNYPAHLPACINLFESILGLRSFLGLRAMLRICAYPKLNSIALNGRIYPALMKPLQGLGKCFDSIPRVDYNTPCVDYNSRLSYSSPAGTFMTLSNFRRLRRFKQVRGGGGRAESRELLAIAGSSTVAFRSSSINNSLALEPLSKYNFLEINLR